MTVLLINLVVVVLIQGHALNFSLTTCIILILSLVGRSISLLRSCNKREKTYFSNAVSKNQSQEYSLGSFALGGDVIPNLDVKKIMFRTSRYDM